MSADHLDVKDRFGRQLERRDGRDFPFYNREPVEVSTWKWIVIIVSCAIAFIVLISIPQPNNYVALIPRILFPVIMLVVFALLTGGFWRSIFHKLTGWDVLNMVFFAVLNTVVALIVGGIIRALTGAADNAATQGLAQLSPGELFSFYLGTGVQLFGEELFTILPFLAVMYWLYAKAHLSRKTAIILAWLITAVWFGAAHLPTYDWNVLQAVVGIGVARLVLTLAFIRTKNILVSTGAHILNDWAGFTFALLTGLATAGIAR
ncbi:CPBP family intramembrane glutamic endopeptidase [Subtercola lobariae]|uniref:CAAX amino protease n=1 Tax=Subtercola lobariae TaxID=1588641 RepID=A0A917F2G0_9MICO|nr:type II CAAX endopeptidase family protein [Subtercola lobariae]GGF38239.1 CAAX amino protease [Subtercola lobariae]